MTLRELGDVMEMRLDVVQKANLLISASFDLHISYREGSSPIGHIPPPPAPHFEMKDFLHNYYFCSVTPP